MDIFRSSAMQHKRILVFYIFIFIPLVSFPFNRIFSMMINASFSMSIEYLLTTSSLLMVAQIEEPVPHKQRLRCNILVISTILSSISTVGLNYLIFPAFEQSFSNHLFCQGHFRGIKV